jgi:hypothetical protein
MNRAVLMITIIMRVTVNAIAYFVLSPNKRDAEGLSREISLPTHKAPICRSDRIHRTDRGIETADQLHAVLGRMTIEIAR